MEAVGADLDQGELRLKRCGHGERNRTRQGSEEDKPVPATVKHNGDSIHRIVFIQIRPVIFAARL
jgi:hypothetical protein